MVQKLVVLFSERCIVVDGNFLGMIETAFRNLSMLLALVYAGKTIDDYCHSFAWNIIQAPSFHFLNTYWVIVNPFKSLSHTDSSSLKNSNSGISLDSFVYRRPAFYAVVVVVYMLVLSMS